MPDNLATLLHREGVEVAITTVSSREFNQHASKAKKAAERGPVFITHRGRPANVLLTIEEYRKITDKLECIVDLLAMPNAAKVEFAPPRFSGSLHRPADFD
jgi:prevent-host-death family protein